MEKKFKTNFNAKYFEENLNGTACVLFLNKCGLPGAANCEIVPCRIIKGTKE